MRNFSLQEFFFSKLSNFFSPIFKFCVNLDPPPVPIFSYFFLTNETLVQVFGGFGLEILTLPLPQSLDSRPGMIRDSIVTLGRWFATCLRFKGPKVTFFSNNTTSVASN